jgi:16S rRNA C967 or C1407 C5-methylase (RsmB/RsmF family)
MELPQLFLDNLKAQIGDQGVKDYLNSLDEPHPVTVRINQLKWQSEYSGENVPWAENGFYLKSRPQFSCDPLWHSGAYYVQDASSMFLEHVYKNLGSEIENPLVLDLCGAPGGKTTHLASLMDGSGILVANEVIRSRCKILAENVRKWGQPNVFVTNNDPVDFQSFEGMFDLVVADAPCSGEGLFRKSPESISEWSEKNVSLCASRQQRIIADIWPALKPGGLLIYSTCTFNAHENEENLLWIRDEFSAELISIDAPEHWNLESAEKHGVPGWHFYPHRVKGEGFFIAVIRKNDGKLFKAPRKPKGLKLGKVNRKILDTSVFFSSAFELYTSGQDVYAMDSAMAAFEELVQNGLNIMHRGIFTGTLSDRKFVPSHDLFLSPFLNEALYPESELSDDAAMAMISRLPFAPPGLEKGERYRAIYRGVPIGGFKYLGNRVNTTFPSEWRLRKPCDKIFGVL